jgi:3-hydroxybutyryl-CoA dehydrogenase
VDSDDWTGLEVDRAMLVMTDGRPAHEVARDMGLVDVVVFDRPVSWTSAAGSVPLGFAVNGAARQSWKSQSPCWLNALGFQPLQLADTPGLVVARTVAMLVNEAADAVQQGVCTPEGADMAMKLGVNYPAGPFEWLDGWSPRGVVQILRSLDDVYRGERYRISSWLRRTAAPVVNRETGHSDLTGASE